MWRMTISRLLDCGPVHGIGSLGFTWGPHPAAAWALTCVASKHTAVQQAFYTSVASACGYTRSKPDHRTPHIPQCSRLTHAACPSSLLPPSLPLLTARTTYIQQQPVTSIRLRPRHTPALGSSSSSSSPPNGRRHCHHTRAHTARTLTRQPEACMHILRPVRAGDGLCPLYPLQPPQPLAHKPYAQQPSGKAAPSPRASLPPPFPRGPPCVAQRST